jgi:hypothetical protein
MAKVIKKEQLKGVSSGETIRAEDDLDAVRSRIAAALEEDVAIGENEDGLSPVFKLLREPKLPRLQRENRAQLLMQTPNRVYFYWSLKNNPFQILHRVFGDNVGSYALVAKLINTTQDTEQIHLIDAEGNWWFSVEPDSTYRAEVGFYAPNRPYIRAIYSNTITTPRRSPSPRVASDADWRISADKFAAVLDVAGFKQDAFDVAIAGDDPDQASAASIAAVRKLTGLGESSFAGHDPDDIRYALTLIAMGATLEELRFRISDRLFALLQSSANEITRQKAAAALAFEFDVEESELLEIEDPLADDIDLPNSLSLPRRRSLRPLSLPTSPGSAR